MGIQFSPFDRQKRLDRLVLPLSNILKFRYLNRNHEVCIGIQFSLTHEIAQYAYDLAVWKEPYVIDKSWLPLRERDERIFDLWVGIVSECLTYLYLLSLGFNKSNLKYYDVLRLSPEYDRTSEYDIKLFNENMSLKASINSFYKNGDYICIPDDCHIRGTYNSCDRYYTQFMLPFNREYHHKTDYTCDVIHKFLNSEDKDFYMWLLGGVVNTNLNYWKIKKGGLDLSPKLDADNYIKGIFEYLSIPFKDILFKP